MVHRDSDYLLEKNCTSNMPHDYGTLFYLTILSKPQAHNKDTFLPHTPPPQHTPAWFKYCTSTCVLGSTSHKSQHPASEMAEERRTNIRWTDVMDIELCQQAILVNPWKEGVTWKLLLAKLHEQASRAFASVTKTKSLTDHLDTLIKQRRKENAAELRGWDKISACCIKL